MGGEVRGKDAPVAVHDIRALADDGVAGGGHLRLVRDGGGKRAHPHAHGPEGHRKGQPQQHQPLFGPPARPVCLRLVAQAQVLGLDGVWVLAGFASLEDAGKRAKRRTDHSGSSPWVAR